MPLLCRWLSATAMSRGIGRRSVQIKADIMVLKASGRSPTSFPPTCNLMAQLGRSRIIARHFFDWPVHNEQGHCQGKPVRPSSPARHSRAVCDGATVTRELRRFSYSYLDQSSWLRTDCLTPILESIKSRVGDRGFRTSNRC
jgi:hypothetical protein